MEIIVPMDGRSTGMSINLPMRPVPSIPWMVLMDFWIMMMMVGKTGREYGTISLIGGRKRPRPIPGIQTPMTME